MNNKTNKQMKMVTTRQLIETLIVIQKCRNLKLSKDDVRKYNKRVICEHNDITVKTIYPMI